MPTKEELIKKYFNEDGTLKEGKTYSQYYDELGKKGEQETEPTKEVKEEETLENEDEDDGNAFSPLSDLKDMLEELGAKNYKRGVSWKGFDVIIPVYDEKTFIGEPTVILLKDDEIRYSTPEESFKYLKYEQNYKEED